MWLQFVVFFKDYGNKSTVSSSQLRRIPADVEHAHTLPMQAVPCLLHELSGWNDDVGVEAAQLINSEHPYILTVSTIRTPPLSVSCDVHFLRYSMHSIRLSFYRFIPQTVLGVVIMS